ncbi:hypothetical protein PVAP13_1KG305910 [Panicum virgatum]|uniref:Uncharacterized protein n=1 Tax=Panicum virgatum TaxID=38727 RepID=A0A8T0XII0_PANVG|nr:hypothetical protein PVAP13_1KG305910 [Panicum virgatum]
MRTSPQGKLRQRHSLPDRWSIAHYGRELACIHGDQDDVYGKFCVADSPSSSLSTKEISVMPDLTQHHHGYKPWTQLVMKTEHLQLQLLFQTFQQKES